MAGKALGGASLTGAVLYLVATAPTHVHVYWPYWIFLGGLVGGVALYFAGQERTGSADEAVLAQSDELPELAGPAITDRWQSNLNGASSEMLLLQSNGMNHPGYTSRSMADTPPSVRIAIQVACAQVDPAASSSELRAKFLHFLGQPPVMSLVRELTEVARGAVWTARGDNPPFNFGAVLGRPDTEEAPVAWARVLLPETMTRMYGRDARCAHLVLYVEPRAADGGVAGAASLATWHQRLGEALKLPAALGALLADELALPTANDPPAGVALWLNAPRALTELVEVDAFDVVAGSPRYNSFMGVAIASPDGVQLPAMVQAWLRQMCDSSLHLDNYEADIASLNGSATGPRLTVRVVGTEWIPWRDYVLIAAVKVELANATDSPVRISSLSLCSETDSWDSLRRLTFHEPDLDSTLTTLRTDRLEPELASYQSVPPHGSVSGWVTISILTWSDRGTPELELTVREAVGTTYLTVIQGTEQQIFSA